MLDQFGRHLELPATREQWERLPKHPAFKYEYWDGAAQISPRWRTHATRLDLTRFKVEEVRPPAFDDRACDYRPIAGPDWDALTSPFAAALSDVPPCNMLLDDELVEAAGKLLAHARAGGDGELLPDASFVAVDRGPPAEAADVSAPRLLGASIVTLNKPWRVRFESVQDVDPQPHLTWVFVSPWSQRHGIASGLLAASVAALGSMGHGTLHSMFAPGNDASMRFHWRNGFELLPDPLGRRSHRG